jgi:hypothetical protein
MKSLRFVSLAAIIAAAAASRLLPHPPNFTPIAAIALFGGATFADKRAAFLVPLLAMAASDAFLGGFSVGTLWVYGAFAAIVCIGLLVGDSRNPIRIAVASVTGAILFFVVTNFGVWVVGGLYPRTPAGLEACFVAAIPFFRNTLLSDLLYTLILFGIWFLAEKRWPLALRVATPS